jgi:hypothetical protein
MTDLDPEEFEDPRDPSTPSVAREYRRRRSAREAPYRLMVVGVVVLTLINFSAYYAVNLPSSPVEYGLPPASATADNVTFGATSLSSATCGNGQSMVVETVPWENATVPPSTGNLFFELVESLDGDIDGGAAPSPVFNATSVCADRPISANPSWYVVLRDPGGSNIAAYSYSSGWLILDHQSSAPVADGSTLVFASEPQVSGLSFELCALGGTAYGYIYACAPL